jgi:hypothetical protein
VLAVGVHRHHDVRAEPERDLVADAEREPAAASDRERRDEGAGAASDLGRRVVGTIVDHDRHDGVTLDLRRHRVDHRPDVLGLVVRGGDHDDPAAGR